MCIEYIEAVAISAYNNAITLIELGQYDLAERFVSKVLCLKQLLSNNSNGDNGSVLAQWHSNIQETYLELLKLKRTGAMGVVLEPPLAKEGSTVENAADQTSTLSVWSSTAAASKKDFSLSLATLLA